MVESLEKMISFVLALLGYGRNTVDTSIQWRIFIHGKWCDHPPPGLTVNFWTTFALFL